MKDTTQTVKWKTLNEKYMWEGEGYSTSMPSESMPLSSYVCVPPDLEAR